MKLFLKIAAVCCCICIAQSGFAQFAKGSLLLGGGIDFSNTVNEYNNVNYANLPQSNNSNGSYLGIYPNFAYAIKDNWVASFETGISTEENKRNETNGNPNYQTITTSSTYRVPVNLSIRHYWNLGKKFSLGLGLYSGIGISGGKTTQESIPSSSTYESKITGIDWQIGLLPNLTYSLGDRCLLTLSSGRWGYYQYKGDVTTNSVSPQSNATNTSSYSNGYSKFSGNFSLNNIQIGAYYIIQPKAKKME
jgi:hypothetical protein